MKLLSERIVAALDHAKVKRIDLARELSISRATVSDWCSGKIKSINGEHLLPAAELLGVDPYWLGSGKGTMLQHQKEKIPGDEDLPYGIEQMKDYAKKIDKKSMDSLLQIAASLANSR